MPALYEDKQGTVGVKSDIPMNKRTAVYETRTYGGVPQRDAYGKRRSVSFRAHGRLLDYALLFFASFKMTTSFLKWN